MPTHALNRSAQPFFNEPYSIPTFVDMPPEALPENRKKNRVTLNPVAHASKMSALITWTPCHWSAVNESPVCRLDMRLDVFQFTKLMIA